MLKLLLAQGCKVGAPAADDMNALHFAAQKGHSECVRHLLNAGQYMDSRNRKGFTPLHLAAKGGEDAGGTWHAVKYNTGWVESVCVRRGRARACNWARGRQATDAFYGVLSLFPA